MEKSNTLFRYRVVNKNSIDSLMKDTLYATTPDNFNDPYDVVFQYDLEKIVSDFLKDEELLENFLDDFMKSIIFIDANSNVSLDILKKELKENPKSFSTSLKIIIDGAIKLIRRRNLIVCFSRKKTSEIMWAHYSNYGKGFVVEYERHEIENVCQKYLDSFAHEKFEDKSDIKLYGCFKVEYSGRKFDGTSFVYNMIRSHYKDLKLQKQGKLKPFKYDHFTKEEFQDLMLNKHNDWEYEAEERVIVPNNDINNSFGQIGMCKPKQIFLGEFMDFNDKYLILSICKEKNLPVYQMYSSYSHRNFGLHAKMYTSEEIDKILKEFSN